MPRQLVSPMLRTARAAGKRLYFALPAAWFEPRDLRRYRTELERTQWLASDEIREIQVQKLRRLIEHAYASVPYYRRVFDSVGVRPDHIASLQDLRRIPLLTKEAVREHARELLASDWRRWRPRLARSGGSTGHPVELWVGEDAWNMEQACHGRFFRWAGYTVGQRCLGLRGTLENRSDLRWYLSPASRQLSFVGSSLSRDTLEEIVERIESYCPHAIIAYPSVLDAVARWLRAANRRLRWCGVLITASETLYPSARALIEEHFGSRIFDWYGQGEHMTFAGQCECGTYHLGEEYAITELVDAAGVPVDAGTGYIVGTCLHNYAMPLIRYLTDDIGIWQPKPCGCGRGLKGLSAVEGKQGDFVVTRSGRMVSAAVLYQCLLDSMNIEGAQFVQESNDALRLRLIAGPRYTADEGRCLARRVAKTCNGELAVAIEMVNDIPRTERGKHRLVIRRSTEALGLGPVASLHEEPY